MSVRVAGVGELSIEGYPRNLSGYNDWEVREARLSLRDGKWYLKVPFLKDWKGPGVKDGVVDNIIAELVLDKGGEKYVRVPTRLEDAHYYK
ncbi:hypothetical protein GWK48_11010 [Metallosphaera tengchongensis]|uniref:Transposase n=1 Tax=Metallosphaera tengchongensis TaxID=1532350 RepID=A0A6N0NVS5_9CREN|nr:hypothetical protein [Metallosphaera tengchongensis]QKR00842.1 hypothetical protein GWK48_11010 [Metallosphaera tengchongensis]